MDDNDDGESSLHSRGSSYDGDDNTEYSDDGGTASEMGASSTEFDSDDSDMDSDARAERAAQRRRLKSAWSVLPKEKFHWRRPIALVCLVIMSCIVVASIALGILEQINPVQIPPTK